MDALKAAVADLKCGELDAVVTAPINKESVQSDEWHYTGHTEFFAKEFDGEPLRLPTISCNALICCSGS